MMKKFICIFTLVLSFMCTRTYATHLMGGEFQWRSLGNDTFEVTLILYRRCTDGAAGLNSAQVIAKSDSCANNYSDTLRNPFSYVVDDVTPMCPGTAGPCSGGSTSSNATMPAGVQRHTFKYKYFVGGTRANCCWYRLTFALCCRNSNISTGYADADFSVVSVLNRCQTAGDASPVFKELRLFFRAGQDVRYDHSAYDADGDSLSYTMVAPPGGSYSSPWSLNYPLTCLGGNNPNPNSNPPTGFNLNRATGLLTFRPMQVQITVYKLEVTEWRTISGVKRIIGKTARDLEFLVIQGGTSAIPSLAGPFAYEACVNHIACVPIYTSGYYSYDTVRIYFDTLSLPGSVFTHNNDSVKFASGTICWTPDTSHISTFPYILNVTAVETNCYGSLKHNYINTRSYTITVKSNVVSSFTKKKINCRDYDFIASINSSPGNTNTKSVKWYINNVFVPGATKVYSGDSLRYRFRKYGKYFVRMDMSAGGLCTESKYDTVLVDTVNFLTMGISNDTSFCYGDSVTLRVNNISNGTPPYRYKWFINNTVIDTNAVVKVSPKKPTYFRCELSTADSCTDFAVDSVLLYTTPNHNPIPDKSLCLYDSTTILNNDTASNDAYTWTHNGSFYSNAKNISVTDTGKYILQITSGACNMYDTVQVNYYALPSHNLLRDTFVCIPNGTLTLNTANNFANQTYSWYRNDTLFSTIANPVVRDTGYVMVKIRNSVYGCMRYDTLYIGTSQYPLINNPLTNKIKCTNDSVLLSINDTATTNTYLWKRNGTQFSTQENIYALLSGVYSITVTSQGGCSLTSSDTVFNYPIPTHTQITDKYICGNDSIQLLNNDSSYTTFEWFYNGSFISYNKSIYVKNPGSYTQKITNSYGCSVWDTIAVFVNPYPVHTDIADIAICKGDTAYLTNTDTATNHSYSWYKYSGATPVFIGNAKSIKVVDSARYYVIIQNAAGCSIKDSVKVSMYPGVNHSNFTNRYLCTGDSVFITTQDSNYTFAWYYNGSFFSANKSIYAKNAGFYKQKITNMFGCFVYDSFTLFTNPAPIHTDIPNMAICPGDTAYLLNYDTATNYTYTWYKIVGGNPTVVSNNKSIKVVDSAQYYLVIQTNPGCSLRDSVKVKINPGYTHTKISNKIICQTDSAYLQNIDTATSISYQWFYGGSNISTAKSIYARDTGRYVLKMENAFGCIKYDTIRVDVKKYIYHTYFPDYTVCKGTMVQIFNNDTCVYTSYWTLNGTLFSYSKNVTLTLGGEYVFVMTNNVGCKLYDTLQLTTMPLPTHAKISDKSICPGDSVLLQNTDSAQYQFQWTLNGIIISSQQSIYAKNGGVYYQKITRSNGCYVVDSIRVSLRNVPAHTPLSDMYICIGDSVITQNTDSAHYYFFWYSSNGFTSTQRNVHLKNPGVYILRISSNSTCLVYDTLELFLTNKPYHIAISDIGFCTGDSAYLQNNYVSANTYKWYFGGNLISTQKNIYTTADGEYVVRIESPAGCVMFDTIAVFKHNYPSHNKIGTKYICPFDSTQVTNTDSAHFTVAWYYNGNLLSTQKSTYLKSPGKYVHTVTNSFGCPIFDTFNVLPYSNYPQHHAIPDHYFCENDSAWIFNIDSSTYSYSWYFGGALISQVRNIYVTKPGQYVVKVGNQGACVVYDTVDVFSYPKPLFSIKPLNPTIIKGNSIVIAATDTAHNYQWFGDSIITNWGDSVRLKPAKTAAYKVIARTANNCIDSILFTIVVDATGIHQTQTNKSIAIYPNPATHELLLTKYFDENCEITLQDNLGKLLLTKTISNASTTIDISKFAEGVYLLTITHAGTNEYYKFIKVEE